MHGVHTTKGFPGYRKDFRSSGSAMGSQVDFKQERMWQDLYFRIILWLLCGEQSVLIILPLP